MTITLTATPELVLPRSISRKAGIKAGDQVEVKASGGIVTVIPKAPSADDEYTPEQRRRINAELAESFEDVKHGRVHTFDTHQEMLDFLHTAKSAAKKKHPAAKKTTKPKSR